MTKTLGERERLLTAYEKAVRLYGKAVRLLAVKHGDEFIHASQEADGLGALAKDLRLKIEALDLKGFDPTRVGSVRTWLELEERNALEKLRAAQRKFKEIVQDIPGGIPAPGGILRIQQAGAEVRILRERHHRAARRLLDYLASGTISDDNPALADRKA